MPSKSDINDERIHVALAANKKYLPGLLVTMSSMARSASKPELLRFHIFADGLSIADENRATQAVTVHGVQKPEFIKPDLSEITANFSNSNYHHIVFLRLFFCTLFPFEWVLYTDVDTLWLRDVCELWSLRDSSKSVMWCQDIPSIARGVKAYSTWNPTFDPSTYCCSGVMLMNLKLMRQMNLPTQCIDFVHNWGTPLFVDQDILNYVCRDSAAIIPQHWDCMMPTKTATDGVVYHVSHISQMFNDKYQGWQPLQYPWFRYYYDFILGQPQKAVCGFHKKLFHWLLGTFYPSRRLSHILAARMPDYSKDSLYRQFFFAWLWRHAKWRW